MRNVLLGKILFAVFVVAVAAALALVASNVYSRVRDCHDTRLSRLEPQGGPARAQAADSQVKPAAPVHDRPMAEDRGEAEKMFSGGVSKDFGAVPSGTQLCHEFPLINNREVPITVAYLQPGCGCVTASAARDILQPGESTTIDVRIDTRRFVGPNAATVRVKIVGPDFESTCRLVLTAVSLADIAFRPEQAAFGAVTRGETPFRLIDVEHAGTPDWEVKEVVVPREVPFEVSLGEPQRRPGQISYELKVTLKGDAPAGLVRSDVYLRTNTPDAPLVPLTVTATVREAVNVAPSVLDLGTINAGETLLQHLLVKANRPFRVTNVQGLGDGVTLDAGPSQSPALVQTVTVRCALKEVGEFEKVVQINTDLPEAPITVTVRGTVAPAK